MSDPNLEQPDHAAAVAAAWYQNLVGFKQVPPPSGGIQDELLELTRQIIALSSEDQFSAEAACAIGSRLAEIGLLRVDVFGKVPALLSHELTQGLDPSRVNALHTRLGNVLTQVIGGYFEHQYQSALTEKESTVRAHEAHGKRSDEERKNIELNSKTILQVLPDAFGILNLDGEALYYHIGSERQLVPSDKGSFQNMREYLPAEVVNELLPIFRRVIETGLSQIHEYSIAFEKIGKRYFQDKITPYEGDTVLVISRDITEQKRIEEELRASEARYRSVVETQTELICRFDRQGVVTFVNEAGLRLFRGIPRDIISHNIIEYLHDLDPEANQEAVNATFSLGPQNPSISAELRVLGPANQMMVLECTTHAILDDQGQTVEYQTTARDITELKRIETALKNSEERYRSVVEAQTELIVRILPDATITFVNEALCRFLSKERQDILGRSAVDFLHVEDKFFVLKILERLRLSPPDELLKVGQGRVVTASGEVRSLEWTTLLILGEDGQLSELQCVGRDITELKLAHETLERQNELLRQLNDQLINIQEIERQRIARDLHDSVLNELGAMMIAQTENLTPQVVRNNYEQLIEQLRQTINGLRSPMLNYGLHAALEDLLDNIMDNPQAESISIDYEIPASQARFDLNVEMHLFRIIQQACDNALQHAQAQHMRIYGKIEACSIYITVEDDGIGFQLGTETDLAHVLAQKHFGLVSMLERGKLIGADVQIISHPGAGTRVQVLWEPQKTEPSGENL